MEETQAQDNGAGAEDALMNLADAADQEFAAHVPFRMETVRHAQARAEQRGVEAQDAHVQSLWEEEHAYAIMGGDRPKLIFSNFLLTISTNVVPISGEERLQVATWLRDQASNIFNHWDVLNGTVLKPAGSPNDPPMTLGINHQVDGCRSKVALESGGQRGQMHMHVVFEVAHRYVNANQWGNRGIHVNCTALRNYLNARIDDMEIPDARKPQKIYVHSRLLTRLGQTQQKFMTLQYLEKEVDSRGQLLQLDYDRATQLEQTIKTNLAVSDTTFNVRPPPARRAIPPPAPVDDDYIAPQEDRWQDDDFGVGGGLDSDDPFRNPPRIAVDSSDSDYRPPARVAPGLRSPDSSSFDDRPLRLRQGVHATPAEIAEWKRSEAGKRAIQRTRRLKK